MKRSKGFSRQQVRRHRRLARIARVRANVRAKRSKKSV